MSEEKREALIFDDLNTGRDEIGTLLLRFDEGKVSGAPFFTDCAWVWPKEDDIVMEGASHSHDFDEIVTLFGTNPDDPQDLGAEVEFWLGDEKHTLTKSCLIFVPKGQGHCPLIFRNVQRPIFHYIVGAAGRYTA